MMVLLWYNVFISPNICCYNYRMHTITSTNVLYTGLSRPKYVSLTANIAYPTNTILQKKNMGHIYRPYLQKKTVSIFNNLPGPC